MRSESEDGSPSTDETFEKRWRRRFEERARRFSDEAAVAGWSRTGLDGRFRRFRSLWVPDGRGGLWLDAGCGAGTYTRYLREHGCDVIGMDYSVPSVGRARAMSESGISWCAGDVRQLPVRPQSVDGALCFGVMQALAEPRAAVEQLVSGVRPGGEVWIDGLNRWCLPTLARELVRALLRRPPHLRYDTPKRLREELVRAGAGSVNLHWVPLAPGRWPWMQTLLESTTTVNVFRAIPVLGLLLSHSFLLQATRSEIVD